MPAPIYRYDLDPTGTSPNNLVQDEIISLSNNQLRVAVPKYGPVFAESIVIYDNNDNTLLIKDVDYKYVELIQSATNKFGKEIIAAVLITNQTVSSEIRISYQVLGGLYQLDDTAIASLYDSFLNDTRGVDWSNVLNKPLTFPPSLHQHLLQDIYGFEPVIVSLERIRNAIAATDLPAYQAMVDWVNSRVELATHDDIKSGNDNQHLVTMERLIQALQEFNFNSITVDPLITTAVDGQQLTFNVRSSNLLNNTVLYWTIQHVGTSPSDFNATSGIINMVNNRGTFIVPLADNVNRSEAPEEFSILIRKNGVDGFIVAKLPNITIAGHGGAPIIDLKVACCLYNPAINITPFSMYVTREY